MSAGKILLSLLPVAIPAALYIFLIDPHLDNGLHSQLEKLIHPHPLPHADSSAVTETQETKPIGLGTADFNGEGVENWRQALIGDLNAYPELQAQFKHMAEILTGLVPDAKEGSITEVFVDTASGHVTKIVAFIDITGDGNADYQIEISDSGQKMDIMQVSKNVGGGEGSELKTMTITPASAVTEGKIKFASPEQKREFQDCLKEIKAAIVQNLKEEDVLVEGPKKSLVLTDTLTLVRQQRQAALV